MSTPVAVEAGPHLALEVAGFVASRGGPAWPPGRTFIATSGQEIVAAVRLGFPSPGDGYHREHVRTLDAVGEGSALPAATAAAVAAAGTAGVGRLEAETADPAPGVEEALAAAGLLREAVLPEGWLNDQGGAPRPLVRWGCVLPAARPAEPSPWPPPARTRPQEAPGLRCELSAAVPRSALRAFLRGLAPGRSYPPGTLLSEAEQVETERSGDLDAAWILAMTPEGAVAGGLVLQADPRPARRHVRRVHLDVGPAWRRKGVATALLEAAATHARTSGLHALEADPRAGNAGACGALASAGFALAGRERAAWRLRGRGPARDEDVLLLVRNLVRSERPSS